MASFWFLDTLAFYMLRYKEELDEYYMAVLISWLAGEIKLLRDKKCTRKEFFQEMKNIFITVGNKISQQNRIPYWEEIACEMKEEIEENESMKRYANELRYALVYAVFVEPIEVQTYDLPFTFRHPRLMKPVEYRITPFNIQLQKLLRKNELLQKLKKVDKNKKAKIHEVPPTPPPSLDDEMQLKCNRLFILPLIESNEASSYFETNTNNIINAQH
ncbi:uncharacterized protein LOC100578249 isoform X2 [Apis mellifera]|uniref:Uncharacterized protein LOC100578249 isoform X2 n=1 Tax=Apis mellifera TaxID=7460 RepID=A0A7M7LRC5_APIME|nr:uncharacterized protein LOC100578249 isoform X2 [Apis mellifera]|eukprot:XP_006563551.2 uncharacterized protein LOC100578249 isoform X2 [Apis mellifera]